MLAILMAFALVLASVTIVSPLAGALDVPGDVRLARDRYLAVGGVYYPGFTVSGVAEPLAILALAVLLASVAQSSWAFWLIALALAAEALAHGLYWFLIAPMNAAWLTSERLAARPDRAALLDRWERSHVYRALASTAAFALLVAAALAPAG